MSTQTETPAERIARELESLREAGVVKKTLPTISRSTFEQLGPQQKRDFLYNGGKLTDDPAPAKTVLPQGAVRRSTFDAMTQADRMKFIKAGGSIVDDDAVQQPQQSAPGNLSPEDQAAFERLFGKKN